MTESTPKSVESPPPAGSSWQFSLRTLFVALTITAIGCAWLVSRYRAKETFIERLQELGAMVTFDYQWAGPNVWRDNPELPGDPRLREFLGKHYAANLDSVEFFYSSGIKAKEFTDVDAALIASTFPTVRWLVLQDTSLTDAGLMALSGLASLKRVDVEGSLVTEAGVQAFRAARPKVTVGYSE